MKCNLALCHSPSPIYALLLCPGRWPLTNMCSSFWTSVGLVPVAYILAAFLARKTQSCSVAEIWPVHHHYHNPPSPSSLVKLLWKCARKLDTATEAKDQGHQMHGMTNKIAIFVGDHQKMYYRMNRFPWKALLVGWMDKCECIGI